MTIPKIVAQLMTADEVGWSFFASTESCVVEAASSALLIWEAVKGWVPWTSQSVVLCWMWNSRMACSVITVFGAEVPVGSAPISWIDRMCEPGSRRRAALPELCDDPDLPPDRVVESETRDARETRT